MAKRQHYWLFSGTVKAVVGESQMAEGQEPHIVSHDINALLKTEHRFITGEDLGKSQHGMFQRMLQSVFPEGAPEDLRVVDVFVMAFSYMGHMTDKEFAGDAQIQEPQERTRFAEKLQ